MTSLPRVTSLSDLRPVTLRCEEVPLPEWGCSFLVWELSAIEIQKWKNDNMKRKKGRVVGDNLNDATPRLLHKALKDDTGRYPLFTLEEIKSDLMNRGAGGVAKLEDTALRLARLLDEDDDTESSDDGEGEESDPPAASNSHPTNSSTTDLRSPSVLAP